MLGSSTKPKPFFTLKGEPPPIARPAIKPRPATSRPKVLSFGGCNLEHTFSGLSDYVDHKHIWRCAIPTLTPTKVQLRSRHLDDRRAADLLTREIDRIAYRDLVETDADILAFEAGQDFLISYLLVGDSLVSDIRSDMFGGGLGQTSFADIPELQGAVSISADTARYWSIWKRHFHELYHSVLAGKIAQGKSVVFLARRMMPLFADGATLRSYDHLFQIQNRNRILDEIHEFVGGYAGIQVINASDKLCISSETSPYNMHESHPDLEIYAVYRLKILNALSSGEALAETCLTDWLVNNLQQRSQLRGERKQALAERDAANQALASSVEARDAIGAEKARLEAELGEREARLAEAETRWAASEAQAQAHAAERDAARLHLSEVEAARSALEAQWSDGRAQLDEAAAALARSEAQRSEQTTELSLLRDERDRLQEAVRLAHERDDAQTAELASLREALAERLHAIDQRDDAIRASLAKAAELASLQEEADRLRQEARLHHERDASQSEELVSLREDLATRLHAVDQRDEAIRISQAQAQGIASLEAELHALKDDLRRAEERGEARRREIAGFAPTFTPPTGRFGRRRFAASVEAEMQRLHGLGFDRARYLTEHPDIAATGHCPLRHYALFGRHEGRQAFFR